MSPDGIITIGYAACYLKVTGMRRGKALWGKRLWSWKWSYFIHLSKGKDLDLLKWFQSWMGQWDEVLCKCFRNGVIYWRLVCHVSSSTVNFFYFSGSLSWTHIHLAAVCLFIFLVHCVLATLTCQQSFFFCAVYC